MSSNRTYQLLSFAEKPHNIKAVNIPTWKVTSLKEGRRIMKKKEEEKDMKLRGEYIDGSPRGSWKRGYRRFIIKIHEILEK